MIVPLSTLSNWVSEFKKWCPSMKVVNYKGHPQTRKDIMKDVVSCLQFNVLVTTYDFVIKDRQSLRKIDWEYAVIDEGHRLKNSNSKVRRRKPPLPLTLGSLSLICHRFAPQLAITLGKDYNTKRRILLTGTPLQNNLPELWSLLNFLLPDIFNSAETFDEWFSTPFRSTRMQGPQSTEAQALAEQTSLTMEERMLIINRLHELLRPFMLRRLKSDVMNSLPEKTEIVLKCELSSWQLDLYKSVTGAALGKVRRPEGLSAKIGNRKP